MANGSVSLKYKDHAGQPSSFQFDIAELVAGNIAAQTTLIAALQTATDNITVGLLNTKDVHSSVTEYSTAKSPNGTARRELKWLCTFIDDSTGKSERREIPCPMTEDEALFESNGENLNLTIDPGLAFKTAFEAVVKSAVGNDVTLSSAKVVGRNL